MSRRVSRGEVKASPRRVGERPVSASSESVDLRLLEEVLDDVRPTLQGDGGDLTLRGVDGEGVVTIELTGACRTCPLQIVTLTAGIEAVVRQRVPGVSAVIAAPPKIVETSDQPSPAGFG